MELTRALNRVKFGLVAGGLTEDEAWSLAGVIDCAFIMEGLRGRRLTEKEWAEVVNCLHNKISTLQGLPHA